MKPTPDEMRQALEYIYYAVGDALDAIQALARLAQRECDRGAGKISGPLIVSALYDIVYRAADANGMLGSVVESFDFIDTSGGLQRMDRGLALMRALGQAKS